MFRNRGLQAHRLSIARPAIALIVFFSMVSHWNNFFLSYVMLSSTEKLTLPVGLAQLITASPVFTPGVENGLKLPLYMPELAFAGLMTMVPTLALFAYAQRYLSKGVAMGGLTG